MTPATGKLAPGDAQTVKVELSGEVPAAVHEIIEVQLYIYTYMCICMHIYIYIYIYMHDDYQFIVHRYSILYSIVACYVICMSRCSWTA